MNGRCPRLGREFVALVDYKGSGLVVKLRRERVDELVARGIGRPFAPAGKVFKEWLSVPAPNRRRWLALLREAPVFGAIISAADMGIRCYVLPRFPYYAP